jgi:hypothetical protein
MTEWQQDPLPFDEEDVHDEEWHAEHDITMTGGIMLPSLGGGN